MTITQKARKIRKRNN